MANKLNLNAEQLAEIDVGYIGWQFIKTLDDESLDAIKMLCIYEVRGIDEAITTAKLKGKYPKKLIDRKGYVENTLSTINGHSKKIKQHYNDTMKKYKAVTKELNELRKENRQLKDEILSLKTTKLG